MITRMNKLKINQKRKLLIQVTKGFSLILFIFLMSACSVGAYPVDYFQEMHYSPAIRRQEAPVMSAPTGAVAFSGAGASSVEVKAETAYSLLDNSSLKKIIDNPIILTTELEQQGDSLFQRNCAVCHGIAGDLKGGTGPALLAAHFTAAGVNSPVDLSSEDTRKKTNGELFGILTNGQGVVPAPADSGNPEAWTSLTNMPSFGKLLTDDDRWLIVHHIRKIQN